ncbi:MAG: CUAEP/CCAEP-tail radical SAM (seleno)protein [Dehalococcoidia bacterium]
MNVVLISTYELGRQPFGLASAAAWLNEAGASVTCLDLAVQHVVDEPIRSADVVAFYVPMHTATRIATAAVDGVKRLNPTAHLCFFGLYAPVNEGYLRKLGADTILGGEFEEGLVSLIRRLAAPGQRLSPAPQHEPVVSMSRMQFLVPDRSGLPMLGAYAHLTIGTQERRTVGYTEASRGCKHLCRHCPIVPVYQGRFRIVQREVVLEDIRRQVAAGAQHITFGDPDFFNGIGHAIPLIEALHREHPTLTYDVTIKIEHLLKHREHLVTLRDTGCLFVTSAVEAIDDTILAIFEKHHTRDDFVEVVSLFRQAGLMLFPTFVTFTPWTSLASYRDLLALLVELELVDYVPPIQLAIRLLIPAGSRLLELPMVQDLVGDFDEAALYYPWAHADPRVDQLHADVLTIVQRGQATSQTRRTIFEQVWQRAHAALGLEAPALPRARDGLPQVPIPYLSEPWFC